VIENFSSRISCLSFSQVSSLQYSQGTMTIHRTYRNFCEEEKPPFAIFAVPIILKSQLATTFTLYDNVKSRISVVSLFLTSQFVTAFTMYNDYTQDL